MEIGKRIATIRKQKGLSQKELSEKIGLKSVQGLQKIEYGDFHPKKETLQKIAKVLGVSIIELDDDLKETVDRWNQEHDIKTLPEDCRPEETTFGERLKTIRKEKGFTQKSLGLACGLKESSAESTIRKYEIGSRKPRDKALEKLANVLECDKYELLTGTPSLSKYSFQELWEEIGRILQKVTC